MGSCSFFLLLMMMLLLKGGMALYRCSHATFKGPVHCLWITVIDRRFPCEEQPISLLLANIGACATLCDGVCVVCVCVCVMVCACVERERERECE